MEEPVSVSEFVYQCSELLEYEFGHETQVIGEVSGFKVSQGRWVFFDLIDDEAILPCFMWPEQLMVPIEDGMKVILSGSPKITNKGRFSFTVKRIMPKGEGSVKKAFEILKKKLTKEGLFDLSLKRDLPTNPEKIAVISSTQAAGYGDFIKIINERWGGLKITVAHTMVQGMSAPGQIINALDYLNQHSDAEVIAIIRGGGSADDLAAFNDEALVRAVAASKIPVITGIGHEQDESLVDLAADFRASTPSNVAEILTLDKKTEILHLEDRIAGIGRKIIGEIEAIKDMLASGEEIGTEIMRKIEMEKNELMLKIKNTSQTINQAVKEALEKVLMMTRTIRSLDPDLVLRQGYAIWSGNLSPGEIINLTTRQQIIKAEVKDVKKRN